MSLETQSPIPSAGIIGAGSWGTALAATLAERGLHVTLWSRDAAHATAIARDRRNVLYLPELDLPESVTATDRLDLALAHPLVVFATPSAAVRQVAQSAAASPPPQSAIVLSCTKGIEAGSGHRMSDILAAALPGHRVAVLSGPNHAEEVARRLATATVIGCTDPATAALLQEIFSLPWFRAYTSTDVAGIELGGAIKNVFAIGAGIADGLGLGDNAKAALVTRGLAEMIRLGTALGGRAETFYGLSGVGDLMVTCYSTHSRNHRLGLALGRGTPLDQAVASMGHMIAEGLPNTASLHHAARRAQTQTPVLDEVHAILYQSKPAGRALRDLLSRQPRPEADAPA